jgi:hypothetical protein
MDQTVGTSSFVRPMFTLQNNGSVPLLMNAVALSDTTDFELGGNGCSGGIAIPVSGSCSVPPIFHPGSAGAKAVTVSFYTMDQTLTMTATGNGLAAGACLDSDGDGLCDDWELNGVWVHVPGRVDQFIDLPSMGADRLHKDIFIQADYMATGAIPVGEHSHQMKPAALTYDIAAFANAPVWDGVVLHGRRSYDDKPAVLGQRQRPHLLHWNHGTHQLGLRSQKDRRAVPGEGQRRGRHTAHTDRAR